MANSLIKTGSRLGAWTIEKRVGGGGHGVVWRVRNAAGAIGALKHLRESDAKRPNQRFRDEVHAMRACQDIPGVLPLLDSHLPPQPTAADPAWFVAALATPLDGFPDDVGLDQAVAICTALARTLAAMHARGHSHRDLKPNNIFQLNGQWHLGDFGLADFPDKTAVTREGEKLGPMHYIAPEMLIRAHAADGRKADVYSLGKLLWKLATGHNYPLPGAHLRLMPAMTISANVTAKGTATLDALLESMTQVEPDQRPPMERVVQELEAWAAPSPKATHPIDLAPFTKRAQRLVDSHNEGIRRRGELQAAAEHARDRAFAEFQPVIESIKAELQKANIGRVLVREPAGGNADYYRAVTGDMAAGTGDDRTWMFQSSVIVRIDAGDHRGILQSGLNLGIRNVQGENDTLYDANTPLLAAVGHIVTAERLFGGSWRSSAQLVWGDHDSFVLDQPRQSIVLTRLGSGLASNLPSAVDALLAAVEALQQPRQALITYPVTVDGETFEVNVSEQSHLDGIAAARARSDRPFNSDAEYVQFVLSNWAKSETKPLDQQALQTTLDRAVESYYQDLVAGKK